MQRSFRSARLWALVLIATVLAGLTAFSGTGRSVTAQTTTPPPSTSLNVSVGASSGKAFGQVFTPGEFTVAVGSSVTWKINTDEPHSVTFGTSPSGGPSPFWPVAGWTAPPPGPPAPVDLGSVDYDGAQFLNTSILVKDSKATVHFTAAGDYPFICIIHPGMAGVVHVVSSGTPTTQAEADQKAQETASYIVSSSKVSALRQQALNSATSEAQPDGTTKWTVAAGAMTPQETLPGGGTGYLDLMEFNPDPLNIKAGDTVVWKAAGAHTITFLAPGQTAPNLESQYGGDPTAVPEIKPSDTYDGTSVYTSGLLGLGVYGAPGAPDTFTLTFQTAGTFPYLCLLHDDLGMKSTIVVGPGSALPSTGSGPASSGDGNSWSWWLVGGMAATALSLGFLGIGARRLAR